MAVKMLNSAELRGKQVTAGNIAHYTVLHARCGRRSYAAGSPDVLHPKNRMRNGEPESFDEVVKEDEFGVQFSPAGSSPTTPLQAPAVQISQPARFNDANSDQLQRRQCFRAFPRRFIRSGAAEVKSQDGKENILTCILTF